MPARGKPQNTWVKEAHTGDYNVGFKRVDQEVEKQHHHVHCVTLYSLDGQLQDLARLVKIKKNSKILEYNVSTV